MTYEERFSRNYEKGIEIFYDNYCFDGEEHPEEANAFATAYAERYTRKTKNK